MQGMWSVVEYQWHFHLVFIVEDEVSRDTDDGQGKEVTEEVGRGLLRIRVGRHVVHRHPWRLLMNVVFHFRICHGVVVFRGIFFDGNFWKKLEGDQEVRLKPQHNKTNILRPSGLDSRRCNGLGRVFILGSYCFKMTLLKSALRTRPRASGLRADGVSLRAVF